MGRTFLAAVGLLFILLLVLGLTWVAASRQLAATTTQCMTDLHYETRLGKTATPVDLTRFLADVVNCVDQRKTFLAGLFFNRDDSLKKLEQQYRALADVQQEQFKDVEKYQKEMEKRQNDWEAERNLQQFRQGIYQGSGKQP